MGAGVFGLGCTLAKVRREDIDFRFFQGRLAGK
jgi:hypothetical protein